MPMTPPAMVSHMEAISAGLVRGAVAERPLRRGPRSKVDVPRHEPSVALSWLPGTELQGRWRPEQTHLCQEHQATGPHDPTGIRGACGIPQQEVNVKVRQVPADPRR